MYRRIASVVSPLTGFDVEPAAAPGLLHLAEQVRAVFDAVSVGEMDVAVGTVNAVMLEYDARPVLTREAERPWHLRFHTPEVPRLQAIGSASAVAIAHLLGSEHADRIRVCSADVCDRVYLDTTRSGTSASAVPLVRTAPRMRPSVLDTWRLADRATTKAPNRIG